MLILVGASASGKTEIAKELLKSFNISKVVTHTTRPKRINETNDIDYHFVNKDTFLSLLNKNKFVEHSLYNGNYYGCSKDEIGDNKVVILDPNGLKAFNRLNDKRIVSVLILTDVKTRYQRMISRGDSLENVKKRIENDRISFDMKNIDKVDFVVKNEDKSIKEIAKEIYDLYINELKKR